MQKDQESYLNMWRAIVAMANVDGIITQQERQWIDEFLEKGHLSPKEKDLLQSDLKDPKDPIAFIDKITVASHLSQLHHLSNVIFNVDDFDYKEQKYLEKVQRVIESKIDILAAYRASEEVIARRNERIKKEKSMVRGFFLNLVEFYKE